MIYTLVFAEDFSNCFSISKYITYAVATTNLANIFLPSDQKYIEVQQQVIYMSHEMESLKIGQRQRILGAVVMLFSARVGAHHPPWGI